MLQVAPTRERVYDDPSERDLDNLLKFHDALQSQIQKEGDQGQLRGHSQSGQGHRSSSRSSLNFPGSDGSPSQNET